MPYFVKVKERELGPFEERVVIAHLIDGEINARSLIKDGIIGTYHKIEDTSFNAVLPHLTARWRYNIGALKREHSYMMISLLITLVPLLNFLFGLYNDEWRSFLLNYKCMGAVFALSVIGFCATCYFTWMFAYRCYRVVPKSQYNITPGWRIMLTFIPIFRLGWNYCMWAPLATKLRRLTNYTMNCGRAAAIFYSTNMIVMTVFVYLVIFFNWAHRILDLTFEQEPWENLVGGFFVGILILSFIFTLSGFTAMTFRLKNAALAILRHRYAYNIVAKKVDSAFMLSVLQAQRNRDKARRWGHGLGIGGVLILWPLLLIGIPYLVLYIVGTVKLTNTASIYHEFGVPYNIWQYANHPLIADGRKTDFANSAINEKTVFEARAELCTEFKAKVMPIRTAVAKNLAENNIYEVKKDLDNLINLVETDNCQFVDYAIIKEVIRIFETALNKQNIDKFDNDSLEKYYNFLADFDKHFLKNLVINLIETQINLNYQFSSGRAELMRDSPGMYLYSWTPFCLISRADMGRKWLDMIKLIDKGDLSLTNSMLPNWKTSNVIMNNCGYNRELLLEELNFCGKYINELHRLSYICAYTLKTRNNGNFELPKYKDILNGEDLIVWEEK